MLNLQPVPHHAPEQFALRFGHREKPRFTPTAHKVCNGDHFSKVGRRGYGSAEASPYRPRRGRSQGDGSPEPGPFAEQGRGQMGGSLALQMGRHPGSFMPEGFDRVHPGRAEGRIEAEDDAHQRRNRERHDRRP